MTPPADLSTAPPVDRDAVPAVIIDAKTGTVTTHTSFRGAYRHVCLKGLTEWSWHTQDAYAAWCEAQGSGS